MNEPVPLPRRHVDLDELEREVVRAQITSAQEPEEEGRLVKLGRMSADAVLKQYEAAAKAFDVMGEEVKDRITKLQASLEEADASMKLLTEAAAAIREKGKLAHTQIEEMSSVSKVIREMCAAVMKKIGD